MKANKDLTPIMIHSKGDHISMPKEFFKTPYGLITETNDKRIMYYLPWNDVVIAGTTEEALENPVIHPSPNPGKISEIIDNFKETFPNEEMKILS